MGYWGSLLKEKSLLEIMKVYKKEDVRTKESFAEWFLFNNEAFLRLMQIRYWGIGVFFLLVTGLFVWGGIVSKGWTEALIIVSIFWSVISFVNLKGGYKLQKMLRKGENPYENICINDMTGWIFRRKKKVL